MNVFVKDVSVHFAKEDLDVWSTLSAERQREILGAAESKFVFDARRNVTLDDRWLKLDTNL